MRLSECKDLLTILPEDRIPSELEYRIFSLLQEANYSGIEIHSKLGNIVKDGKSVFTGKKGGLFIAHQNLYKKLKELREQRFLIEINGKYQITDLGWCWLIWSQMLSLDSVYKNTQSQSKKPFFVELFLDLVFRQETLVTLLEDDYIYFKIQEYIFSCLRTVNVARIIAEDKKLTNAEFENHVAIDLAENAFNLVFLLSRFSVNPSFDNINLASILSKDDRFKEALREIDEPYQLGRSRILNGMH